MSNANSNSEDSNKLL